MTKLEEQLKKEGWEHAGVCGVDAGLIWIGDPCYCVTPDANEHPTKTWSEFCDKQSAADYPPVQQFNYKLGHPGLGVCVSSGFGDGMYDVYVRYNDSSEWSTYGKRVAEARIVFIDDTEENEEID